MRRRRQLGPGWSVRYGVVLTLLLASIVPGAWSSGQLHRPAGLERDVEFWRRIFAEVSNDEALVHDDTRLDVVYEIVRLPKGHSNALRRQIAEQATRKYSTILADLAAGNRTALTPDAQRVLALWGGAAVDSATFAKAAGRVRFQLGQSDRFRAGLIRSGLWERYIERTLAEHGVPAELIALPHVESGYDPRANSHVGAAGLWQFMPGTAKDFMRVDALVDERLDPYRATESAARLLTANYRITGSWPTAITAYNHGAGGMRRAIEQLGTRDIETIVRNYRGRAFGFASRNFYVSFLAAVDVRKDAERYFGKLQREAPDPSIMVRLPDHAPAEALARVLSVDRATLARYNPSLRDPVWAGRHHVPRGHRLYLPPRPGLDPAALLAAVPAGTWSAVNDPDRYHVVRPGESLSTIAPRYGLRVAELAASNGLRNPNHVRVGQRLMLPELAVNRAAAAPQVPPVAVKMVDAAGRTRSAAQAASSPTAAPMPRPVADDLAVALAVGPDGSIRVADGESLARYAQWLEIDLDTLRRRNGIALDRSIQVGSTIVVPLTRVDGATFERRRMEHHQAERAAFLARHRIEGTHEHRLQSGESAWALAERRYRIPIWLLREYNPGVDLAAVKPGTRIVIPRVSR